MTKEKVHPDIVLARKFDIELEKYRELAQKYLTQNGDDDVALEKYQKELKKRPKFKFKTKG